MQRTTIAVSPKVRDRLQTYGRKGISYEEILESLMDAVDPSTREAAFQPITHARDMTRDEAERWRKKSPSEKVAMGASMLKLAMRTNPKGYRSLVQSPRSPKRRS